MTIFRSIKHRVVEFGYKGLTVISPRLNTKMRYARIFKKPLNLSCPETFNEKILWLKLNRYMTDPLVIQCADKYRVREYIKSQGCSHILINLIDVYDSVNDINWDKLPDCFAMKWNFGAGFNVICTDKSKLNKDEVLHKLEMWGRKKYWLPYSEMQYKYIPKKIVCEELLVSSADKTSVWKAPYDYKVYCFNGEAKYIMVCVGREQGHPKFYYFTKDWQYEIIEKDAPSLSDGLKISKPVCLGDMLSAAEKMSKPFPFVRCDFYVHEDKLYFGELTFTPAGGLDTAFLPEKDLLMGNLIDLTYGIANRQLAK